MSARRLELHIERLVLHGVPPEQRAAIAREVARALASSLAEAPPGAPATGARGEDAPGARTAIPAAPARAGPRGGGETAAARVGQAVTVGVRSALGGGRP